MKTYGIDSAAEFLNVSADTLRDLAADGTTTKHGGPGRGQGRKPVKQGEETVTISLRMTTAQREKLARLGGAEWVRQKIDRAKET